MIFYVAFLPPKGVWGFPQQAQSRKKKSVIFECGFWGQSTPCGGVCPVLAVFEKALVGLFASARIGERFRRILPYPAYKIDILEA